MFYLGGRLVRSYTHTSRLHDEGRRVKRLMIFDVCNYYLLLAFVRCAELLDKLVCDPTVAVFVTDTKSHPPTRSRRTISKPDVQPAPRQRICTGYVIFVIVLYALISRLCSAWKCIISRDKKITIMYLININYKT